MSTVETVPLISGRVPTPYKLDSFQLVNRNGSTDQSSSNKKVAARATFIMCEPDWTNFELFSRRLKVFSCLVSLRMRAFVSKTQVMFGILQE